MSRSRLAAHTWALRPARSVERKKAGTANVAVLLSLVNEGDCLQQCRAGPEAGGAYPYATEQRFSRLATHRHYFDLLSIFKQLGIELPAKAAPAGF